ncbi:MAG: hypothetical protein PHU14_01320 [Methylovulum sp.]|nr:hypothetical protein [Methylovulum sp.]
MIKHLHKLARYTALVLISASPMPFDDAYAEIGEKQIAAAESMVGKAPATEKPEIEQVQ